MPRDYLKHMTRSDNVILTVSLGQESRHCPYSPDKKLTIRYSGTFVLARLKPTKPASRICALNHLTTEENSRQVSQRGLLGKTSGGDSKQQKRTWTWRQAPQKGWEGRESSVEQQILLLPLGSGSLLLLDTGRMVIPCLWDW